jgi:hypothetical protein
MATDLSDDVQFFVRFFQEQHLDWIADQLASVIQEGKSDTKKIKKLKRDGVTTRPFNTVEQEAILLDLLEAYFVTLPELLPSAESALNESLHRVNVQVASLPPASIVLRELESDENYTAFTAESKADVVKLGKFLTIARSAAARGG